MTRTVLLGLISILLVATIIRQPDEAFQASLQGLTIWWNIVFPGLLPFLVLFEIISAFGLIHGIGVLLRPIMRVLFRLPGEAALPLLFGWMSGFQAGAEGTAALRREGTLTRHEGQRLLALAHMPNPLFMLVVIGAGFMHKPELGIYIAGVVWLSALWTAAVMRLLRKREPDRISSSIAGLTASKETSMLHKAAVAVTECRERDGRGFGKILGDAVSSGVQKLMVVGGFMIFAAVVARLAQPLLSALLPTGAFDIALPALLESHIGAYAAAVWQAPELPAAMNAAAVAAVLAWSGLSAILQTGYSIQGTDMKLLPFIWARLLHSLHAAAFALLLWTPAQAVMRSLPTHPFGTTPAMLPQGEPAYTPPISITAMDLPSIWTYALTSAALLAAALLVLALLLKLKRLARS